MGKLSKLDADKQDVIVEMYRDDGKSLKAIATEYDCTPPTVATFLRSKGVTVRGKGKRKKVEAVDKVMDNGYTSSVASVEDPSPTDHMTFEENNLELEV